LLSARENYGRERGESTYFIPTSHHVVIKNTKPNKLFRVFYAAVTPID
jgi:hypothetical protein